MGDAPIRPRLRPGLAAARDAGDPSQFVMWDQRRLTHRMVRLTTQELVWAQLFDGRSDHRELQMTVMRQAGGMLVDVDDISALASRLDDALLLDSTRFHDYVAGPVREPSCIGCYPADPAEIRNQLTELFTSAGGPGLPNGSPPSTGSLRALLVPHMDYARGNVTYGWGFKELFEKTAARLFVIVATSHYSPARFTLTRQNFSTPLGTVETDQSFIDRLVAHYGDGLFSDPYAHLPEHSVELEVVLLQYLYENHGPFRIVPLVVGSFADAVMHDRDPSEFRDIQRLIAALKAAEGETPEEVCYIISGDLAHIGPKFDDPEPVHEAQLAESRRQDEILMHHAAAADASNYFRLIAAEGDARRICGLPPTWTTLQVASPSRGRLLHYQQFVHPEGFESVSFASMAFDR